MDDPPADALPADTLPWASLLATEADTAMLIAEVEQIPEGRLAGLIYTSGTAERRGG
jgi:acyl-CoA synthetase (AMP-forming)/AMP-acid ligase II